MEINHNKALRCGGHTRRRFDDLKLFVLGSSVQHGLQLVLEIILENQSKINNQSSFSGNGVVTLTNRKFSSNNWLSESKNIVFLLIAL